MRHFGRSCHAFPRLGRMPCIVSRALAGRPGRPRSGRQWLKAARRPAPGESEVSRRAPRPQTRLRLREGKTKRPVARLPDHGAGRPDPALPARGDEPDRRAASHGARKRTLGGPRAQVCLVAPALRVAQIRRTWVDSDEAYESCSALLPNASSQPDAVQLDSAWHSGQGLQGALARGARSEENCL
jgi:hypothetical protein